MGRIVKEIEVISKGNIHAINMEDETLLILDMELEQPIGNAIM